MISDPLSHLVPPPLVAPLPPLAAPSSSLVDPYLDPFENPVEPTPDELKDLELHIEVLNKMEEISNEIEEIVQPQIRAFITGRPEGPTRKEYEDLTSEQFKAKRLAWIKQYKQQFKDDLAAYKNKLENSKDVKDKIRLYNLLNDSLLKDNNEKLRVLKLVDERPVITATVQAKLRQEINDIEEDINLNPLPQTIAFIKLLRQRRLQDPSIENKQADQEYQDFLFKNDPRKKQQEVLRRRINDKRFLDETTARQVASMASVPSVVKDDIILDILKASNISPPEEEKEEEVKGPEPLPKKEEVKSPESLPKVVIKPSKKLVTANDIREEIKAKMKTLMQEIKAEPDYERKKKEKKDYKDFLKEQEKLYLKDSSQGLSPEKVREHYINFINDLEKDNVKLKRYNAMKASLLDDNSVKGIAAKQNIQNLADARNFEMEKKGTSKRGKEYFERKLEIVKGELEEKEGKYLVDDPDNPEKKMLNPNLKLGFRKVGDKLVERIENSDLINFLGGEKLKEQNDPTYKSKFLVEVFDNDDDIKSFLAKYDKGIDFIEKNDKYMIDSFIDNIFDIKNDSPIPIIFDIMDKNKYNSPRIAQLQIDYIIDKYIKNIPDKKTRKDKLNYIISYIIKRLNDKYYIYGDDINKVQYTEYINNLIERQYSLRNDKGNEQYNKDIAAIPKITEIKNMLDKIDSKRITLQDKLDVAEKWNELYKNDENFSKIWTYMGLDKDNFYGNQRGSILWDKIFKSNPAFSEKHNLFAIGNLKEALERRGKMKKESGNITSMKDIKDDFIQKNITYFDSKGETLTPEEALQLFTNIINSIRSKNPSLPTAGTKINTLSSIKKGLGISKRRILKYLKGKTKVSKPTTKGLDTEILKILNS